MSFLTLNGWAIPVKIDTPRLQYVEKGARSRIASGQYRSTRYVLKRRWQCETAHLTSQEARALKGLLRGEGYYWSFDRDLYSEQGVPPETGYSVTYPAATSLYGSAMKVNAGGSISWDLGLGSEWTVMAWRDVEVQPALSFLLPFFPATNFGDVEEWHHVAITSADDRYRDGVSLPTLDSDWLSVSGGVVTLQDTDHPGEYVYDELLVLPFVAPASLVAAIANLGRALTAQPYLWADGEAVVGGPVRCIAEPPGASFRPWGQDGVFYSNGQTIEFVLREG